MQQVDRTKQLSALVIQAAQVKALAYPTTAGLLRVLDALTPPDIEELSLWQLRNERTEAIIDRLTAELGEHRAIVRGVLGRCLRLDLWGNFALHYAALRQQYEQSGEGDATIEATIGRPPATYSFLLHGCIRQWQPVQKDLSMLIIEDDRWGAVCDGYLVAKGRAFSNQLALLEVSAREEWEGWQVLWQWF